MGLRKWELYQYGDYSSLASSRIRAFVSIDIEDSRILSDITSVTSSLVNLGGDLKPVERENIHLTLKFLGYISESKLYEVKQSLETVRFPTFEMEIKGTGAFPAPNRMRVIWVGIEKGWSETEQIYEQTEKEFARIGFARENRAFTPHITVARVRSGRNRNEMAEFLRGLQQRQFGTFKVEKVRLKQSLLSSEGPRYSTLSEATAGK